MRLSQLCFISRAAVKTKFGILDVESVEKIARSYFLQISFSFILTAITREGMNIVEI